MTDTNAETKDAKAEATGTEVQAQEGQVGIWFSDPVDTTPADAPTAKQQQEMWELQRRGVGPLTHDPSIPAHREYFVGVAPGQPLPEGMDAAWATLHHDYRVDEADGHPGYIAPKYDPVTGA